MCPFSLKTKLSITGSSALKERGEFEADHAVKKKIPMGMFFFE
jgi:hypothetical protein